MSLPTIAFFSPIAGKRLTDRILKPLDGVDFVVQSEDDIDSLLGMNANRVILFIGTGGTEGLVASFVNQAPLKSSVLLAHMENNSLPAAMEIRAYLEQCDIGSEIKQGSLGDLREIIQIFHYYEDIFSKLNGMRIGIIGNPSSWLIASQIDKSAVQKNWGVEIINIPFSRLESIELVDMDELAELEMVPVHNQVEKHDLMSASEITRSLLTIKKYQKLDALTLDCFRLVEATDVTGCLALATLNSLGTPAGCEGDVPSTFTMLLAKLLTGQSSFMANVIGVNKNKNSVVLAHCTVPFSLVDDYDFMTHYETGKSVGIRGRFPKSDVTLLKVFGSDLSHYWVAEGTIQRNLTRKEACRTQLEIRLDSPVDYFLQRSLANHHILIPGSYAQEIRTFLEHVLMS
ncbi:MAG: fucose isomerase [Candidatus Thorarchaeota archaeon]|nr:fucose isomerase [Candidatus Thorarchaeota archaeon]